MSIKPKIDLTKPGFCATIYLYRVYFYSMLERGPTEQNKQDFRRPAEPAPEVIIALPKPDLTQLTADTQNEIAALQEKIAGMNPKTESPK